MSGELYIRAKEFAPYLVLYCLFSRFDSIYEGMKEKE